MPVLAQGPRAGEVPWGAAPASTVPPGPGGSLQEKWPVAMVPTSLCSTWPCHALLPFQLVGGLGCLLRLLSIWAGCTSGWHF